MTPETTDVLLETLASIEVHAGEEFDLDVAVAILERAAAGLQQASPEERRALVERAEALGSRQSGPPERDAFLLGLSENLGLG